MLLRLFQCCSIPLLMVMCQCENQHDKAKTISFDKGNFLMIEKNDSTRPLLTLAAFRRRKTVRVINLKKETDTASVYYSRFEKPCSDWRLDNKMIVKIMWLSKEIKGEEWHWDYDVLPCSYTGEIEVNGKYASFSVNAGAFINITLKDTVLLLGYKLKDYKKYFISGRASPGEYK